MIFIICYIDIKIELNAWHSSSFHVNSNLYPKVTVQSFQLKIDSRLYNTWFVTLPRMFVS